MNYELTRFNTTNYLLEKNKTFCPIPDHIRESMLEKMRNRKQPACLVYGIYCILYAKQDEFNRCELPLREKCKKFFDTTERVVTPVLNELETFGFIIQKTEKNKKIILVQYPEYIQSIGGDVNITETVKEITIKETKREIRVNGKKQVEETKEEIKQIESGKDKATNLKDDKFLDDYILWSNQNNKTINNPIGFKKSYEKNPNNFNFSEYENYLQIEELKKQEEIRTKEEIKTKEERIKANQEEKAKIDAFIKDIETNNSSLCQQIEEQALKNSENYVRSWGYYDNLTEKEREQYIRCNLINERKKIFEKLYQGSK